MKGNTCHGFLKTMLKDIFQNNGPNALHGGLVGLDKVVNEIQGVFFGWSRPEKF